MPTMLLMGRAVEAESQDIRRLGGLRVYSTSKAHLDVASAATLCTATTLHQN
jgi:hypothetical protein